MRGDPERPGERDRSVQLQMVLGVEIGQKVRVFGKRGSYRVVGLRPGGVQLMDEDQKWHVVRPEAVRSVPSRSRPGERRTAG